MNTYSHPIPPYGDVMTVADFEKACQAEHFIDDDGTGHPAKDGMMDRKTYIYPSGLLEIPSDATHVVWFNK